VQVGKAPSGIWKCYSRGGYATAKDDMITGLFTDKVVRFGAYGDPSYMPQKLVTAIVKVCKRHTGYTHQWQISGNEWLRDYVMASCDTNSEAMKASNNGWRYFRVAQYGDSVKIQGEISCPASKEAGSKTKCHQCALCDGARPNDMRKNIVIMDHSVIAKSSPLIQIEM
jgi:hypothetical protein